MRFGIISAMTEEIELLVSNLEKKETRSEGMRDYHEGTLWGHSCVLAFSRWGKVAAATTATHLISAYKVDALLFTGVAGAVAPGIKVGDVVIGTDCYQHDMDARPFFKRHEIPLLGRTALPTDQGLRSELEIAAGRFFKNRFKVEAPKVYLGEIASGDQFYASKDKIDELTQRFSDVLCVEMEGAAVAQVCHDYQVPFAIVRIISDSADEHAPINFRKFITDVARFYSHGIIREFLTARPVVL